MCRHWHIGLTTYRERVKRGWPIEKALTSKEQTIKTDPITCVDHTGEAYPSKSAMCAAWGVKRYCYDSRIALGWTVQQFRQWLEVRRPVIDLQNLIEMQNDVRVVFAVSGQKPGKFSEAAVVTTNGMCRANGRAVMGAGIAKYVRGVRQTTNRGSRILAITGRTWAA